MKFNFKFGQFDLKAEGNTLSLKDISLEVEMTSEEFVQNSKDGVLMVKNLVEAMKPPSGGKSLAEAVIASAKAAEQEGKNWDD